MDKFNDFHTVQDLKFDVKKLQIVAVERIKVELERLVNGLWADEVIPVIEEIGLLAPWQSKRNNTKKDSLSLKNISTLNANEQSIALPLIRLTNLLSDQGLEDLGFAKKKIRDCYLLRYWYQRNDGCS